MAKGTIKRLVTDRGFGFIETAEGKDLFFHRNQLEGVDYNSLREGQQVEFEVGRGSNGRPQAVKVRLTGIKDESIPKTAVMGQNRFRTGLIAGIIVTLLFGVALYLRVVLPYDKVFVGDWIKFTSSDAYFFMRQVDNLVHNFPHLITFDPYRQYPYGSSSGSQNLFVYLLSGIAWLVGLGSPSQHTVDIVGVYFPAIVGAIAIIPVYFIGKEVFNRWVGIIAAGLVVILPGEFLGRSILGFANRDALEVLLTVLTMLFLILAIKSARQKELTFDLKRWNWANTIEPLIYSLLTGILLGFYLLTWIGAFLFVFIIFIYFIIQSIIDHLKHNNVDYLSFVGTIIFLVALLIFLPSHPSQAYLSSLVIAALTPLVLAAIAWLMSKTKAKVGYYPLALFGLGLVVLAILYIVNPSILKSILGQLGIFAPSGTERTVFEMVPILFPSGNFTFSVVWGNFTTSSFLVLIPLGIIIYLTIKRGEPDKTLITVWSLVILGATLALRRFALFLTINVALLTGYFSWLVLTFFGFQRKRTEPAELLKKANQENRKRHQGARLSLTPSRTKIALGVIAVFFVVFFPNIRPAINTASDALAPSNGWYKSLSWLKDSTPDPFDNKGFYYELYQSPFDYPKTAYGIMSWWDYGYWIIRIAHRPVVSDPGGGARETVARFLTTQDEVSAVKIAKNLGTEYVIIDSTMPVDKFYAVSEYAGSAREDFYDVYYQQQGDQLVKWGLFYPEYYRTMLARLYNFDGSAVTPQNTYVISYEEKTAPDGSVYKLITQHQMFSSYEKAETYIASQTSGNHRIVGIDPFISPVPLEPLVHFRLVYGSESVLCQPGIHFYPQVKIFAYTEK